MKWGTMPRKCTVCEHPQRDEIDAALVAGEPLRNIAQRVSVSSAALCRHKADHLPATLAKAAAAADVAHADNLLDQVKDLQRRTLAILDQAEQTAQLKTALTAIGQARGNLELLARLLGELQEQPTINLMVMPEWVTVRGALLAALGPYPEARAVVAAELGRLKDGHSE